MITPNPKFIISLSELKRHPGEKIDVDLLFPLNERIGIDIIGAEVGSEFSILGRVEAVSTGALLTVEIEADATARTASNAGIHFNVCTNYGGRRELVHAARRLAEKRQQRLLLPHLLQQLEILVLVVQIKLHKMHHLMIWNLN